MRVIIAPNPHHMNQAGFSSVLQFRLCGKPAGESAAGDGMSCGKTRLLSERSIEGRPGAHQVRRPGVRPVRSVTVNLAESPLGWLFARGHVSLRQYEAGERLRSDWERAHLAPRVTMAWDAAPVSRARGVSESGPDLNGAQMRAAASRPRSRTPVPALPTSSGGWCARARECATPKPRSVGQRAPASLCSASRSTGLRIITACPDGPSGTCPAVPAGGRRAPSPSAVT